MELLWRAIRLSVTFPREQGYFRWVQLWREQIQKLTKSNLMEALNLIKKKYLLHLSSTKLKSEREVQGTERETENGIGGRFCPCVCVCECVFQLTCDSSSLMMTHTHTPSPPTAHKAIVVNK